MLDTVRHHGWRRARAAYYAYDLGRLPLGDRLGRAVGRWEATQGFGDSPKPKATWDEEYGDGRWDYIRHGTELARYWTLIGYMDAYRGDGAFLDVGCGDGVLFERFRRLGYERYVGIDISDVAVERLRPHEDERTRFAQADGNTYEPPGRFDVVVLNESLYYLQDPVASLLRYGAALTPGGCLVVSTYTASRRSLAVLREAKRRLTVVDEARTTHGEMSWLCTVLRP